MIPPLNCTASRAVAESVLNGVCNAFAWFRHRGHGCIDARTSFLLLAVDSLGLGTHFAGDHRVVGVTVSAVIAAGGVDTVQQESAGDNEIQLVLVT